MDNPIYARCSARNRWYWAVWDSLDAWFESAEPMFEGWASSAAQAEKQALDAQPDATKSPAWQARSLLEHRAKAKRRQRRTQETGASKVEYVYGYKRKWQIAKRTAKRIYVYADPHPDEYTKTAALDRAALEGGESVWSKRLYAFVSLVQFRRM